MIQHEENRLADLWGDLGQEAEALTEPGKDLALPREPVTRRDSGRDRSVRAFLNGFMPAYMMLVLGGVLTAAMASRLLPEEGYDGGAAVPIVVMLMALPVAWLLSALLAVERATQGRILLLAVLAGGLGQISLILPFSLLRELSLRKVDLEWLARMLQNLFENYLSLGFWLFYLALGLCLSALLRRFRRTSPWVETRSRASWPRKAVAWLVAASPLLLLGACAVCQGRIAPATQALRAEVERSSAPLADWPPPSAPRSSWGVLWDRLRDEDPEVAKRSGKRPNWSRARHREFEQAARQLLSQSDPKLGLDDVYFTVEVLDSLLHRPEDLTDPISLAQSSLGHFLSHRPVYRSEEALYAVSGVMLPMIAATPLSATQLKAQESALERLEAKLRSPQWEADVSVVKSVQRYASSRLESAPRDMHAFGLLLPFSIEQLAQELRLKQILDPYLELRGRLDWSSQPGLERSLLREMSAQDLSFVPDWWSGAVKDAVETSYSLRLRPYLQTARVIVALRLQKLQGGDYPKELSALQKRLPSSYQLGSWSYSLHEDGRASLSRPGENNADNKAQALWTLP